MSLPGLYVVGDSISLHYGPYLEQLCQGKYRYLRTVEKGSFSNLDTPQGSNNGDSGMALEYLQRQKQAGGLNYDILLLNCGLHDVKTVNGKLQVAPQVYRENLEQILKLLQREKVFTIWITTTPVFDRIHNRRNPDFQRYNCNVLAYNQIAGEVMEEHKIPKIDLYTFTMPFLPQGYQDHVHFQPEIRQRQAEYIMAQMQSLLG